MGELAVDNGKTEVKKEVEVGVTSLKQDGKDKPDTGKAGPSRILRYAEV